MPGYISLHNGGGLPAGGTQNWSSAFLPGIYQATNINTGAGDVDKMIENIRNPYVSEGEQRRQLDLIHQLNELHAQDLQKDAQLEARIEAYEIAFRMQAAASEAFNIGKEPQNIRDLYGSTPQGKQMLIARRLLESGVRFVQVWAGGWDHHQDLEKRLPERAKEIDQPLGALMTDLKQRGMLDSTLVIWGGEFGRTPTKDRNGNANPGRDHNAKGFSIWMAGGGVKGGTIYGSTDELGAAAVENPVHVHDLHATILRLLGFDHNDLSYRYNGRDFHLTDIAGSSVSSVNVVKGVMA
jgi:membrane-anchored protein YejM (alkaline phosphatase superfamily)